VAGGYCNIIVVLGGWFVVFGGRGRGVAGGADGKNLACEAALEYNYV